MPTSNGPAARYPRPVGPGTAALALLTSALWGGTPVAIRFTTDTLPPVMVAAIRFALATVFMVFWCRWEGSRLALRPAEIRPILVAGGLLFIQIVTFNVGVASSNSSHGSLFINTFIFWVAPIEHFVTRTLRLTARQWAGLLLAGLSGFLVLAGEESSPPAATAESTAAAAQAPGAPSGSQWNAPASRPPLDAPTLFGDLVLIGSAVILAAKIVYTKHAVQSIEPGRLIFWHDAVGTLLFLAFSGLFETTRADAFTLPVLLGLAYQGVLVAGLCFAIQAVQLRHHSASQISVFSASTPLFGILFGVLLRGDALSPWVLGAGIGIAGGIWLVTRDE